MVLEYSIIAGNLPGTSTKCTVGIPRIFYTVHYLLARNYSFA
jgi:hypothetical protein